MDNKMTRKQVWEHMAEHFSRMAYHPPAPWEYTHGMCYRLMLLYDSRRINRKLFQEMKSEVQRDCGKRVYMFPFSKAGHRRRVTYCRKKASAE